MSRVEDPKELLGTTIRTIGEFYIAGLVPFATFDHVLIPLMRLATFSNSSPVEVLRDVAVLAEERKTAGFLKPDTAAELQVGIQTKLTDAKYVSATTTVLPDTSKLRERRLFAPPLLDGVDLVVRGKKLPDLLQSQLEGLIAPASDEIIKAVIGLPVSAEAMSNLLTPLPVPTLRMSLELPTQDISIATRIIANLAGDRSIDDEQSKILLTALVTQFNPQSIRELEYEESRRALRLRSNRRSMALGIGVSGILVAIFNVYENAAVYLASKQALTLLFSTLLISGIAYVWDDRQMHIRNVSRRLASTKRNLIKQLNSSN